MKKVLIALFCPFILNAQTAFISGNDTICDNGSPALVKIDFNGVPPFTFIYEIDGFVQLRTLFTQIHILLALKLEAPIHWILILMLLV